MKHSCPFCGHPLIGTELGNHIDDVETSLSGMKTEHDAEMKSLYDKLTVAKSESETLRQALTAVPTVETHPES